MLFRHNNEQATIWMQICTPHTWTHTESALFIHILVTCFCGPNRIKNPARLTKSFFPFILCTRACVNERLIKCCYGISDLQYIYKRQQAYKKLE